MTHKQDPKEKDSCEFPDMSDNPDNNGSYRDEARIVPMRFANDDDDVLDDGEDEDIWDDVTGPEHFD